jgi:hypothetical protein
MISNTVTTSLDPSIVSEAPARGVRSRTFIPDPQSVVDGWAFGISMPAFAEAFDLDVRPYIYVQKMSDGTTRKVRRKRWTRGDGLDFQVGDTFHAPLLPPGPWGLQKEVLTHTAKVVSRKGDELEVSIRDWKADKEETHRLTQQEFVDLLRSGVISPVPPSDLATLRC